LFYGINQNIAAYSVKSKRLSQFYFFEWNQSPVAVSIEKSKDVKANADILLTPQYDLTIKDYFVFKTVDCQVKGFPGTIKNVTIKK